MSLRVGDRLVCRSVISFPTCILDGHLRGVTYSRGCIGTIVSPDDDHEGVRNMYRAEINIYIRKNLCLKLVIYQN
jgi:hypothetical protein